MQDRLHSRIYAAAPTRVRLCPLWSHTFTVSLLGSVLMAGLLGLPPWWCCKLHRHDCVLRLSEA